MLGAQQVPASPSATFWQQKTGPALAFAYQVLAVLVIALAPFLATEWIQGSGRALSPVESWAYFYLPYGAGVIYLVCGLWVFSLRWRDLPGRAFTALATSGAIALAGLFDAFTSQQMAAIWVCAIALVGGSLIQLALIFPEAKRLAASYPSLPWGGYLLAGAIGLTALVSWMGGGVTPGTFWLGQAAIAFLALASLIFLISVLHSRIASTSPLAREQSRLILLGFALALGPVLLWSLIEWSRPGLTMGGVALITLAAFPILMAYAMLRYRMIRTNALLSRAAVYALLSILVIAGYAFLVSGLSLITGGALDTDHPLWIGTVVFMLAIAFQPLRDHLQRRVDAFFARGQAAYQERLQAFGKELTQAMETAGVLRIIRRTIRETLAPVQAHVFLMDGSGSYYAATSDETGRLSSELRFPADSALVKTLSQQRSALYLGDETYLPAMLQAERGRLVLLDTPLFVPLPGKERLIGWMALGPRWSGEPYSEHALAFLESLGDQAALALERAQVLANLEHHLREMDVLARVAEGINVTLAFDDLLEMFYAQTNQLIPTRDFRIMLKEDLGQDFHYVFYLENDERLPAREGQSLAGCPTLDIEVVRSRRAIVTEDYANECCSRGMTGDGEGIGAWMGVPLRSGADTIGSVSLGSRDQNVAYTAQQANLLQAIADLAAGAIIKARLLEESEMRARQLAILNDLTRRLTSTLELEPLLNQILHSAVEILECEAGSLLLVDEETGESVFEVVTGPVAEDLLGRRLPPGAGLAGKAVKTGQPIIQNDVSRSTDWYNTDQQTGYSTRDMLVVPMLIQERVIGVLEVLNKRNGLPFTWDDLELLSAFAGQAAVAIQNARLYTMTDKALAARVDELSVMQRIDRELNASLDLERALRIALDWAMKQSQAEAGLVCLVHDDLLRVVAMEGFEVEQLPMRDEHLDIEIPAVREALVTGQPQCSYRTISDFWQAKWASQSEQAVLLGGVSGTYVSLSPTAWTQAVVPIQREGKAMGAIILESTSTEAFSPEILVFLTRLSDHAAIAVSNAQLYAAIQSANQAKSQFVSLASHELKNPLTSIKGYTDLLAAGAVGPVTEAQARFLSTIRSNAERMSTLVSDLQDISRIEAGQLRLQPGEVSLAEVVEEVSHTLSKQIEEKGQTLEVALPGDLPAAWGDQTRMVQVLTNLISNAHKYTPDGGRILVWAERADNQWDREGSIQVIHTVVEDTGIGISPEDQRKIFHQFFRSEDPRAREVTGTGLGLNIAKHLVELQGGCIWFESVWNQGTRIHFTIPVADGQSPSSPVSDAG